MMRFAINSASHDRSSYPMPRLASHMKATKFLSGSGLLGILQTVYLLEHMSPLGVIDHLNPYLFEHPPEQVYSTSSRPQAMGRMLPYGLSRWAEVMPMFIAAISFWPHRREQQIASQ